MAWTDDRGHVWKNGAPQGEDTCQRPGCGRKFVVAGRDCLGLRDVPDPVRLAGPLAGFRATERAVHDAAEQRWCEVEDWMRKKFEEDLERLRAKAIEYGSSDLTIMGKAMESLLPEGDQLDEESRRRAGLEMAIGFYLMGKAARLFGAWEKGREPSEDTWHDARIYADMARCVRETGRWM